MSAKKSAVKSPKVPKPEEPQLQETASIESQPEPEALESQPEPEVSPESVQSAPEAPVTPVPIPTPTPAPPVLTLKYLNQELQFLRQVVEEHASLIIQLQETLARKRKPVASNGKVQIRDKQTGTVYPSKNNAYQTLLKSGELKELVEKGAFGDNPAKNTFGWYALVRELPDRFEEVKPAEETQQ
jgi:hypothetical protein